VATAQDGPDFTTPRPGYYLKYFAIIAALLVVTVLISFSDLPGHQRLILSLIIAGTQAGLLSMFFMHLRKSDTVTLLVAAAGLFWLFLLFVLLLTDYVTRHYAVY
jgi:caa(3)-type oxidase subunit IV